MVVIAAHYMFIFVKDRYNFADLISLTVVDSGFVKLRWYNVGSHTDYLVVVPTSQASAIQRAGRAGRTRSGKVYR